MNLSDRDPSRDDILLDRLVEGELSEPERRALLSNLDLEPDGWRRCALAFLEAQAWRLALRPSADAPGGLREEREIAASDRLATRAHRYFARAAAALAAFGLGWASHGASRPAGPTLAEGPPPIQAAPEDRPEGAQARPIAPPPALAERPREPAEVRLPIASAPPIGPNPRVLPDFVRGQLERQGYRVEQARGVLMAIQGGRRVAVPVNRVKVRYVGRRTS